MGDDTLRAALEREHRDIDRAIEAFTSGADRGAAGTGTLTRGLDALRRHIYLEEEFLFPPLRDAGLVAPIFVMIREHGQMWHTLDALDVEIGEATIGEGAIGEGAIDVCRELMAQLDAHNSKEEPILYPRADAVLSESAAADLRAFLESGRMPAGWVCHGARS